MFPALSRFPDLGLLHLGLMVGLVFATSGYSHLKNPDERAKSIGMSEGFTLFLGIAEVGGGLGVAAGVLTQLAGFGLILLKLGRLERKSSPGIPGPAYRLLEGEGLGLALRPHVDSHEPRNRLHQQRGIRADEVTQFHPADFPAPPGSANRFAPPRLHAFLDCSMLTPRLGFEVIQGMQRWTARFLVLIALVGTFLPLALAGTAAPAHLCCRRAGAHRCHSSALPDPEQPAFGDAGCNRDCCRVATTAQCARPEPLPIATRRTAAVSTECDFYPRVPASAPHRLHFGRAPPTLSNA